MSEIAQAERRRQRGQRKIVARQHGVMKCRDWNRLPMAERHGRTAGRDGAERIAMAREHRLVGGLQPELANDADLDADLVDEGLPMPTPPEIDGHGRDARFPKLRAGACGRRIGSPMKPSSAAGAATGA